MSPNKDLKFPQINKIHTFINRKKIKMFAFTLCIGIFGIFTIFQLTKSFINFNFNTILIRNGIWNKLIPNEMLHKTRLKHILNCHDTILEPELLTYGDYWLLKNYIRGRKSSEMGCAESITYTTHGDYRFIEHLPRVVERWLAPISFALYAPGDDYYATIDSILYALNCLPESDLIRDYVTFHIYMPRNLMPKSLAKTEMEILQWPYNCNTTKPPYLNVNNNEMYKTQMNLTYPINVGRNIARKSVNTYFIFACDIELYPNYDLVPKFLKMVEENPNSVLNQHVQKVFVISPFEIEKNSSIPNTKHELTQMLKNNTAIPFHYEICKGCHEIPHLQEWLNINDSDDTLNVFITTKRYDLAWEPFYISDNNEPLFDERVTWEGQSNKRIQNYAMCLLDYEYHILHPAFLIHAPGIKTTNTTSQKAKLRLKYVNEMLDIINLEIIQQYDLIYGYDDRCVL